LHIIVIGCGVSGLTSGIRLLEAGHQVTIWARELPPHTTSNVAAAIWYPYKAFPVEKVTGWSRRSFEVFVELAEVTRSGVRPAVTIELLRKPAADPWWRSSIRQFRRATPDELPPGYVDGYVYQTMAMDTGIYMDYLVERFKEAGGEIVEREVSSLGEPLAEAPLVVNCSGLGARTLAGDDSVFPIRGQVLRVAPLPVRRVMLDDYEDDDSVITYIVPRTTDCILGGTVQVGDWNLEPKMATAEAILARCARLAPEVRGVQILEHLVGLRPGRDAVRLEAEALSGGTVVHNYGHGGAGLTLSWGCAEEVVSLASLQC
jgi:D-amino-acid oxidase